MISSLRPPPPRLAVRIGVTGHRPNHLVNANMALVHSQIGTVLNRVATTAVELQRDCSLGYDTTPAHLRIVSSLAEGSDRVVAIEGLRHAFELHCPLPFAAEEYERDFHSETSRTEYRHLLQMATAVLQLDGERASEDAAYERAGRVMLAQSDILIAVWERGYPCSHGGTREVVRAAGSAGIPVVWIAARTPHEIRVLVADEDGDEDGFGNPRSLTELPRLMREMLAPSIGGDSSVRDAYFNVDSTRESPFRIFESFRAIFATRAHRTSEQTNASVDAVLVLTDQVQQISPPVSNESGAAPITLPVPAQIEGEYTWADTLAKHYGSYYRDSFVAIFGFGAAAVGLGLLQNQWLADVLEIFLLIAVVLVTVLGRRFSVHRRWLHFRLLAEQLRQTGMLYAIGHVAPSFRVPAHAATADPGGWWVSWLVRARVRETPMVNARLDAAYLNAYRLREMAELAGQVSYHRSNATAARVLASRVQVMGLGVFAIAILACFLHLVTLRFTIPTHLIAALALVLPFLRSILPAVAAAFAGIASQGEFGRIGERSHAMELRLAALLERLIRASATSDACGRIADHAAAAMTAELLDWQITFRDKRLKPPS